MFVKCIKQFPWIEWSVIWLSHWPLLSLSLELIQSKLWLMLSNNLMFTKHLMLVTIWKYCEWLTTGCHWGWAYWFGGQWIVIITYLKVSRDLSLYGKWSASPVEVIFLNFSRPFVIWLLEGLPDLSLLWSQAHAQQMNKHVFGRLCFFSAKLYSLPMVPTSSTGEEQWDLPSWILLATPCTALCHHQK